MDKKNTTDTESFKTILTYCDVNAKPDDPNEDPLLTKVRDLGLSWPNIEEQRHAYFSHTQRPKHGAHSLCLEMQHGQEHKVADM